MSAHFTIRRKTVRDIAAAKGATPLVVLTAHSAPMAQLLDPHCDIILVGDSTGMVYHGLDSTVGVTMEMMIMHGQAVMRRSQQAMVVVDMPFGSYETNPDIAFLNAARLMKETGCQAVKIESGKYAAEAVAHMVERGIPVMAHVGLRPQAMNVDGGFRAKGRTDEERLRVLEEAKMADEAGCFSMVIEGVDESLAEEITQMVSCPTIGIGASAQCDGQVLVTEDMLGLFDWVPKFAKKYGDIKSLIEKAAEDFAADVKARQFPGEKQVYSLNKTSK